MNDSDVDNPSDYYNVFDLFALPSLFEGLPVVGIEAQANIFWHNNKGIRIK